MAEFSRLKALRIYELQTFFWERPNPTGATPPRPRSNGAVDESTVGWAKDASRGTCSSVRYLNTPHVVIYTECANQRPSNPNMKSQLRQIWVN